MSTARVRIAPSPTGYLHIGTARTALFNYLFAKKSGGAFIVRIEDTDLERSDKKFEAEILESLEWLGIKADESPSKRKPGDRGPYRQSERLDSYEAYVKRLLASGAAFYCAHSETDLDAERKSLMAEGKAPVHWCDQRDSDKGDGSGIIRFKTERGRTLAFDDMIRGEISFSSDLLGDFSIAKNVRAPLYNFAVVADDAAMGISHVIRGEDHVANTPKQILIQEALGFPRPTYAHLPLILGPDRSKLSKRHGATSIREFRELGYLPEALVNFMTLLGWNPGGEREIFSMDELIRHFDLAKVQKSGAVFDIAKLDWMNGEYIRQQRTPDLARRFSEYYGNESVYMYFGREYLENVLKVEQPRLKRLSDVAKAEYFFTDLRPDRDLLKWKDMTDAGVRESLERSIRIIEKIGKNSFTKENLETIFLREIGRNDRGELLWPLRAALSARKDSAGPFEIMEIIASRPADKDDGRERILKRLRWPIEHLFLSP